MTDSESTLACPTCGGSGRVTAAEKFLLARLRAHGDSRWIGASSDAMVVAVLTGEPPSTRPCDGWDLGRCLVTQAVAPPEMAAAMQPIIDEWTALIEAKKPYHGVTAARGMLEKHADDVREKWL